MKVIAGALAAGIVAVLLSVFGPKAQFTVDGYDYAIMMLMDRGLPYAQAQSRAAAFLATQPIAQVPKYDRWLHGKPEYWELFSVRQVDPWVASLLYPWRGFSALVDVARASYVAVAILIVVLAARFVPIGYAVGASVLVSLFPPWRDLGRDALTDALAVALLAATLVAALALMRRRLLWRLVVFTALCGALTFTRPIAYVIAGGAGVALLIELRRRNRDAAIAAGWLCAIAVLWTVASVVALDVARAPSFGWIVADTYHHLVARGYAVPGENLVRWYVGEETTIALHAVRDGTLSVLPLLAIAGMVLHRKDRATPLLAGVCGATWLGAVVDPNSLDMIRCVVMPVAPAIGALAAAAVRDAVTFVPRWLGPRTQSLRLMLPGRSALRKDTVKE